MSLISSPLDSCLGSQAKVRLLRFFCTTGEPVSGREAARKVGMSKRSIDLALRDLVEAGVVGRKDFSSQALFQINPHSALAKHALFELFMSERKAIAEFFDTLRDLVELVADIQPIWAGLFGSTARGEDDGSSDIDLAVVVASDDLVDPMLTRLSESAPMVRRRFGRVLSPVVISHNQLIQLHNAGSPLVAGLRSARQIGGTAPDMEELLHDSH